MSGLVEAGRFAEIVARAEADIAEGTRLPDGVWRGYEIYMAFEEPLRTRPVDDPIWEHLMPALKERAQRRTGDVFLYVQAIHARAWNIRGGGVSRTVTAQRYEHFREWMGLARDALDRNRAALQDSPMWWAQRITVANELGEGPERLRALFQGGVSRFPDFHPLYWTTVRALTPKWGGSEDALMDLLDTVAAMPEPALKEGLYARILWAAETEDEPLFLDPRFKKAVWAASFGALVQRWPDTWNRQRLFFTACELADKPLAAAHVESLDRPLEEKQLQRNHSLVEDCRVWARGGDLFLMGLTYRGKKRDVLVK